MELPTLTKPAQYCKDTGHLLENCVQLEARNNFLAGKGKESEGGFKLTAPAPQGQGCRGGAKLDPPSLTRFEDRFEQIVRTLTSSAMSTRNQAAYFKKGSLTMSIHYHGIPGFKSSILVGLRIHGDAHS